MKRSWLIGIAAFLGIFLLGIVLKTTVFNKKSNGAISVSSIPKAIVFIDGNQVGTTSYLNDKIRAGEHTVKLVPEETNNSLFPWEGKVVVNPNVLTVINRNLSSSAQSSSGEIFWLEKIASKDKASITIISSPDQAVVRINGEPKGFSPITIDELNPGGYQVVVASTGYEERTVSAQTVAGFRLIINVQLARKVEGVEEATPSGENVETTPNQTTPTPTTTKTTPTPKISPQPMITPPPKPYIKIKETPTGWLRVRIEPGTSATEAAKVNPGEIFPYLEEEKTVGGAKWYKIEYEKNKEGWVISTYVELVE
jgi:hypothetical protein